MTGARCCAALMLAVVSCGCGEAERGLRLSADRATPEMRTPRSGLFEDEPTVLAEELSAVTRASLVTGQEAGSVVFGFVRPDGVVLPTLVRTPRGWAEVTNYVGGGLATEPGVWAQAATYYLTDTLGVRSTLDARRPVRICCDQNGNRLWAHSTDRSGESVEEYNRGTIGYAFSATLTNAPFIQTSRSLGPNVRGLVISNTDTHDRFAAGARRPTLDHIRALLDSLAPMADSILPVPDSVSPVVSVDLWEADLQGESHAYIQITQIRRWQRYDKCFRVVGWLTADAPPRVAVTSSGTDDCDGKGHGLRRPWTLFREGGRTYAIVAVYQYADGALQIWRHESGTTWIPVELAPSVN